jgi:hypothetical protein
VGLVWFDGGLQNLSVDIPSIRRKPDIASKRFLPAMDCGVVPTTNWPSRLTRVRLAPMSASAAATPTSSTPILDRQTPLPLAAPRSGARLLIGLGIGLVIGIAVTVAFWRPVSLPSVRQQLQATFPELFPAQWTAARIASLGFLALVVAFAAVAVHEIGHVCGGLCAGFRFKSLRVGPIVVHRGVRISLDQGSRAWLGGAAQMIPVASDRLAARALALVCAGPAASLLSGCAVLLLPSKGLAAWLFALGSVAGGLGDLVPFRTRTAVSDGARIWMLLRNRGQGERWLALMRLGADLADGVPPESLPADYLAKAIAARDQSADAVTAHAVAYSAAFHQHRDVEAGHLLETCLELSSTVAPAAREALMSDAAVFQARRRKRADLAAQWLARMPATSPQSWLRSRAEAAVLEAQGNIEGAVRKLDEYENAIRALPDLTQREVLLRGLRRWRSELPEADTLTSS